MRAWWVRKSGWAKTVTGLAVLLILQIGLCFASSAVAPQIYSIFHLSSGPEQGEAYWGLTISQAFLCLITFVLLGMAILLWMTSSSGVDDKLTSMVPKGTTEAEDKSPSEIRRGEDFE